MPRKLANLSSRPEHRNPRADYNVECRDLLFEDGEGISYSHHAGQVTVVDRAQMMACHMKLGIFSRPSLW